jgi:L-fuconolactonase
VIIDAHQHFWQFDADRDSWITDEMKVIRKDFLPADLKKIFNEHGVEGSVLIQAVQSENENHFLLAQADENDFIKGVVGWVDLHAINLQERLIYYKQYPKMKGFRHVLQSEQDRAYMLTPGFKRGIEMFRFFNFTYDILVFPDQLKYVDELVSAFPQQPFVIDHLAKPQIKTGEIRQWANDMKNIALHENVSCKISGMVTEADWKTWKKEDLIPYMDVIVEAFGTGRMMYGSDYPVCLLAATYEQVLDIVKDYFSGFTKDEQAQFFSDNAIRFYNLND